MSAEPNKKRLKPVDENKALIIARIKQDYQKVVVANLRVIQQEFDRDIHALETFNAAFKGTTDPLAKIRLFVEHCYELQAIRRDIQQLDKYPRLIVTYIRKIDDPTETKGMAKLACRLEEMSRELSDEVNSVYEQTAKLRKLYLATRENLNVPLDAFMQPWLDPECRDAISQSLNALEAAERAAPHQESSPSHIKAGVLVETQLPKAGL